MLTHIHIKNFTIISQLDLELQQGLTILTGETGAGKSIIIDALQIALGERADSQLIRQNTERCEISAIFALKNIPAAQAWLQEHEVEDNEECIISRILTRDGRSRNTVNGRPFPLQQVRELGELLAHIHGQHQQQALLKIDYQRELLDNFAEHLALCDQVQLIYREWRKLQNQLAELQANDQDQTAKITLLQFQLEELEKLALKENELTELEQEHKQLANAEQLIQHCQTALTLLTEDEQQTIASALQTVHQQLSAVSNIDNKMLAANELINNAIIQVDEAVNEIKHYLDNLELNPERLQWVDQRLSTIYTIARKHKTKPQELINLQQNLQQQLNYLRHADKEIEKLQQEITLVEQRYYQQAQTLSNKRAIAAKKLEQLISEQIKQLGMPNGQLQIKLHSQTGIHAQGSERIEFLVIVNPGQPLQPLNKVASGGELSRVGLAIQVITAQKIATPTVIFDEVDVGIGGSVAEIVGKLLKNLSQNTQVLCITHLPQVAAQGQQHLYIQKQIRQNATETAINLLNSAEKIQEIARMLGGVKITDRTLAHAKEMLGLES